MPFIFTISTYAPENLPKVQVIDQNVPAEHSFVVIRFFNEDKVLRIDFGQDWKDLGFHVAQLPPKTVKKPSNYAKPLPIRAQVEIDRLLENRNLRPRPVRGNDYIVEKILDTRIHEH